MLLKIAYANYSVLRQVAASGLMGSDARSYVENNPLPLHNTDAFAETCAVKTAVFAALIAGAPYELPART